jgi:hypothetical protein
MGLYYCPNIDCSYSKSISQGGKCPQCGTDAKPFGFMDGVNLTTKKKQRSKVADKLEKGAIELLITPEMSNEDIVNAIYANMLDLAGHEAGTGWMRLGTLLSGNSTDQMLGAGFKALIDQNKIIIRQNELILRALQKQPPPPP